MWRILNCDAMKATLRLGLRHVERETVTPEKTISFQAPGAAATVFATPQMVALMEKTARHLLLPHLEIGEASVGATVNARHLAATPTGAVVRCEAELRAIDGRQMTFFLACYEEPGGAKIGECEHTRAVIDVARFAKSVAKKAAAFPSQSAPVSTRDKVREVVEALRGDLQAMEQGDRFTLGGARGGWEKTLPLLRATLPTPWGDGGDFGTYATQIEELAQGGGALAMSFHLNRLMAGMLLGSGTKAQQNRHVANIARGQELWTFCLSEPQAGSDAAAIATRASPRGGGWVLNGVKSWIGLGMHAAYFIVIAVTDENEKPSRRMSAFLLPRESSGLRFEKQPTSGYRGYGVAQMTLENVFVPRENLLGEIGEGLPLALRLLDAARVSVAALGTGFIARALQLSLDYTKARVAFGKPLAEQPVVGAMLSEMSCDLEAARLLTHQAAYLRDHEMDYSASAARAKLFATEAAMKHATSALQLHGAAGYVRGCEVEQLFRDAKGAQIFDGASEVQRLVIARELLK